MKSKPIAYQTDDGYIFYLQKDGTLTDTIDPDKADMIFESLEQLEDGGETIHPLGSEANELAKHKQSKWMEGWLKFMEGEKE